MFQVDIFKLTFFKVNNLDINRGKTPLSLCFCSFLVTEQIALNGHNRELLIWTGLMLALEIWLPI